MSDKKCVWKFDDYDGCYHTLCDNAWFFDTGSMGDNGVKFCPYCGKPAVADYSECTETAGPHEYD